MKQLDITLLAIDFKPNLGGVAEYTLQLAQGLDVLGLLSCVITPVPQTVEYSFRVKAPKEYVLSRVLKQLRFPFNKIYSLLYLLQLQWIEYFNLYFPSKMENKKLFIINWIVSPLAMSWLNIIQKNKTPYALILYGKDIIVSSKEKNEIFLKACQEAELLIFCSQSAKALFEELQPAVKTRKYVLLPGIDFEYLQTFDEISEDIISRKLGVSVSQKTVISSVARLVKRKGIDLAIKAVVPILKSDPDLIYIIAGDGEEYNSLEALIESFDLKSQIRLLGRCTDQEKFSLLKASSIFLMPNHQLGGNDFEGFGISFIEASYFNNLVIGGRSGGAVEAIVEGVTGILVDTDSDQAVTHLRARLQELIQNPAQVEAMSESGHKYVCETFSSMRLVQEFSQHL